MIEQMSMVHGLCEAAVLGLVAAAMIPLGASPAFAQNAARTDDKAKFTAWEQKIKKKEQAIGKRLLDPPEGEFYQAMVPDTLDLADRARLAINCLTGALDPDFGYELYLVVRFNANPPFMHHEASGLPTNNPKFAESLPMMRLMSGSRQNVEIERGMMLRTLALVAADGLYYAPVIGRPWRHTWHRADDDFANVYGNGRLLLALMAWYQYDGNPLWVEYIEKVIGGLRRIARFDGDKAYFPDPRIGESFSFPKSGYPANLPEPTDAGFGVHMYFSGVIRALAKWSGMTGDKESLDFARRLANFVRQPRMWQPTVETEGVAGSEKGRFSGHFHAHTASLRGLLEYAIVANEPDLKELVRDGYEYARNFGISRVGWFPENARTGQHCESCCIADMVALAVKLSDAGIGDYWEDVDRYVRNQLIEQQLVSRELLEKLAAASPPHKANPPWETDDRVIERNIGGFVGHGDMSVLPNTWIMHCCTGNASQALYYAWEGIVRENGNGTAQINLLLNRASPWLDVHSYLPYEGKVVIQNKEAKKLFVRIPTWVSRGAVRCWIGSKPIGADWVNNYLMLGDLRPDDKIEIRFPMVETTTNATLEGVTYALHLRGDTLIGFSSRPAEDIGIRGGRFALPRSTRAVVKGVTARDVRVTVAAKSNAEAGIMLRYHDPSNFLLAIYANRAIYFHEVAAGNYGQPLNWVSAEGFAANISLVAEVRGSRAILTVTDSVKTVATKHKITSINDAGGVGLFHNGSPAQLFDGFSVSDLEGDVLFEDHFSGPNGEAPGWKIVGLSAGGAGYPIYRREHIRGGKAPMVRKKLYVIHRHIEG